jgi:hypothetical protein
MASKRQKVPEGMHLVEIPSGSKVPVNLTPDDDGIYRLYTALRRKSGCTYFIDCGTCIFPKCRWDMKSGQKLDGVVRAVLTRGLFRKGVSKVFLAKIFNTTTTVISNDIKQEGEDALRQV